MPIDLSLPPRTQGMLRDVSLFVSPSPGSTENAPALIAQKMLHQSEHSGAKRVIAANQRDPMKKRQIEERAASTFHKKMRKEEEPSAQEMFADQYWREMVESQRALSKTRCKPKAVRKKRVIVRCLKSGLPLDKCDLARRALINGLGFRCMTKGNKIGLTNNIYVIASGLLDVGGKRSVRIQTLLWLRERHPTASVYFKWVEIPHGTLYASENFLKVKEVLHDIPPQSRIFIHEENRLLCAKERKKWIQKKTPETPLSDKVIVFDPEGSPIVAKLFGYLQQLSKGIPHHYITRGSSLAPLNRLTERSRVYFSNKDELIEQTPKMLTARGFRVIHSLKK